MASSRRPNTYDTLRNGYYIIEFDDWRYEGEWVNGEKCGKGKIFYSSGDIYDGYMDRDKKNGLGTISHRIGGFYTGDWLDDLKDGLGEEEFLNGYKYIGHYSQGLFNGEGNFASEDSSYIYKGSFLGGNKTGFGNETMESGSYGGRFLNGLRHGKGKWSSTKEGYEYNGDWFMGMREGYGVEYYIWGSGGAGGGVGRGGEGGVGDGVLGVGMGGGEGKESFIYEGEFKNGLKNGNGLKIRLDGSFLYGQWVDEKLHGLVYESIPNSTDFKFGVYHYGVWERAVQIAENMKSIISGYHETVKDALNKNLGFIDNECTCTDYYQKLLQSDTTMDKGTNYRIMDLKNMKPAASYPCLEEYFSEKNYAGFAIDRGEIYDTQL